jgi:hypothetical protein
MSSRIASCVIVAVVLVLAQACDKAPGGPATPTAVPAADSGNAAAGSPANTTGSVSATAKAASSAKASSIKKPGPDVCAPAAGGFTLASTNPFFPLQVGREWQYEGEEEGTLVQLHITVLDAVEVVAGVTTHVVEERELHDGELAEVSRNFFVEASNGAVCYFGEAVDIYEGGAIVSHEGSWRADQPGNQPGIIMPADPRPGTMFVMEIAPGVAEDQGKIVGSGPVTVPAGTFLDAIRVKELNPLDGERGLKVFVRGVGLVIDGSVQLVSFTS